MSLIDDIRRDREAGTPGPWTCMKWGDGKSLDGCSNVVAPTCEVVLVADVPDQDARRIARVPELEEIALAAEGCANWCDVLIEAVLNTSCNPDDPEAFDDAIRGARMFCDALRKAMEAAE